VIQRYQQFDFVTVFDSLGASLVTLFDSQPVARPVVSTRWRRSMLAPGFLWMKGAVSLDALYMIVLILATQRRKNELVARQERCSVSRKRQKSFPIGRAHMRC
jgi:hypothetical protein